MIYYLVAERLAFRMQWFLDAEPSLAGRLEILPYERAWSQENFAPGVYIFSDLEWLTAAGLEATVRLWERLRALGPKVRLLNDPARSLDRYELLRVLHDDGINRFRAYRLPSSLPRFSPFPLRYPVFLRPERAHVGPLSGLLYSWRDVRKAFPKVVASGEHGVNELLVVEWCDTSDDAGVFRKYSAFVIGDAIVPRHLVCSRDWKVKTFALLDRELLWETRAYVAENPHAVFLREIARRAAIEWGRFDYSLFNGEVQIWEINTNPMVIGPVAGAETIDVDHLPIDLHRVPMRRIATALMALEDASRPMAAPPRSEPTAEAAAAPR